MNHYIITNIKGVQQKFKMFKIAQEEKEREAEKKIRRKKFCKKLSLVYNPMAALTFVTFYWAIGLKNAQFY